MNLKRFISFSIPLILMLYIFVIYLSITKIVTNYEQTINKDYSIVVVTSSPIVQSKIEELPSVDLKEITHLKRDKILKDIKDDLSEGSFSLLQKRLPYFYTISLKQFPTSSKLKKIKQELKSVSGVKSVETFSKDHNQVYSLLLLVKTIVSVLFCAILIFTFLVISNQVKIWFFEHKERLDIIKLHGGSVFYGAKPIIIIALSSSILSSIIVIGTLYLLNHNLSFIFTPEIIEIILIHLTPFNILELLSIFAISLILSIITVFGILIKHRLR